MKDLPFWHCPNCNSENITSDALNSTYENNEYSEPCLCADCGCEWLDVYEYKRYEITKKGNPKMKKAKRLCRSIPHQKHEFFYQ